MRAASAGGPGRFAFFDHSELLDGREGLFLDEVHLGDVGNRIIADMLLRQIDPIINEIVAKRSRARARASGH